MTQTVDFEDGLSRPACSRRFSRSSLLPAQRFATVSGRIRCRSRSSWIGRRVAITAGDCALASVSALTAVNLVDCPFVGQYDVRSEIAAKFQETIVAAAFVLTPIFRRPSLLPWLHDSGNQSFARVIFPILATAEFDHRVLAHHSCGFGPAARRDCELHHASRAGKRRRRAQSAPAGAIDVRRRERGPPSHRFAVLRADRRAYAASFPSRANGF